MQYTPNKTELYLSNLLLKKGITKEDLNIKSLAEFFNIKLCYSDLESSMITSKRGTLIFIDENEEPIAQYYQFLHELSHYIQNHLSFQLLNFNQWKYIELKAEHIIRYIAMPYFLIDNIKHLHTIQEVSEYFFVSYELAFKRLEEITNKQILHIVV